MLTSLAIDIPAGQQNHVIEDSYVLPVDLEVIAVFPHAHYLAQELRGYAVLPDGLKKSLLLIKKWDFNWQGEYRYAEPVSLPKGTKLCLEFSYDNSTNNVHLDPPPQRVSMGDSRRTRWASFGFQSFPGSRAIRRFWKLIINARCAMFSWPVRSVDQADPAKRCASQARFAFAGAGKKQEAWEHFQTASLSKPEFDEPHVYLGEMLRLDNKWRKRKKSFETVPAQPAKRASLRQFGFRVCRAGPCVGRRTLLQKGFRPGPHRSGNQRCS